MSEIEHSTESLSGKYLTFIVADERYGIEILKIQEIIKVTQITKVPRSEPYIKGVLNLRGKIIPVLDLRLRFGLESIPYDDRTCIVIVNLSFKKQLLTLGVVVDTVLEVVNFAADDIKTSPNFGKHVDSNFIIGMAEKDQHHNILIDINKIVSDQSLSDIEAAH